MPNEKCKFWIKGKPLPEGCEDMGIAGMVVDSLIGETKYTFDDEIPEHIKEALKQLPNNSILYDADQ